MTNYKICTLLIILYIPSLLLGQLEYLRLSPNQKITQRVGATDVEIEFSRPQMKGRQVFGGLVPYDNMWRTGANENTKITIDHRVKFGNTEVSEGTYALMTKPMKNNWEIYLYTDTNNFDIPDPIDGTKLIYLTTVQSYQLPEVEETLVINIYDITEHSASLGISWEKTGVKVPMTFYTREAMEKKIDAELKQNILDYSIAAAYYSERDMELEKAKKLQELSIELRDEPSPWAYHAYGKTLRKLGDMVSAKNALEYSLELSKESNNTYLIKENKRILKELKDK